MPSYKVIYFNNKGRAEAIRMAFAISDVEFTDERLTEEEWQKLKPSTPQGKLPVLDVDGKMIPQSNAILSYVGRKCGLNGINDDELTDVEVVLYTLEDVFQGLGKIYEEKDEAKKNGLREAFRENTVPGIFSFFRKTVEKTGSGWLVGAKVTIADLAWFQGSEFIQILLNPEKKLEEDLFKDEPALMAHRQKVMEIDRMKTYLANRPVTQF